MISGKYTLGTNSPNSHMALMTFGIHKEVPFGCGLCGGMTEKVGHNAKLIIDRDRPEISRDSSEEMHDIVFFAHRIEEGIKLSFPNPTDVTKPHCSFLSKRMPQRISIPEGKEAGAIDVPVVPTLFSHSKTL